MTKSTRSGKKSHSDTNGPLFSPESNTLKANPDPSRGAAFGVGETDWFIPLSPNSLAACYDWGVVGEDSDRKWGESVRLYPRASLKHIAETSGSQKIFVVVPSWITNLGVVNTEGDVADWHVEVPVRNQIPVTQFKHLLVLDSHFNELVDKFQTYNRGKNLSFEKFSLDETDERTQIKTQLSPGLADKVRGCLFLTVISEIYGSLIDAGQITRQNKRIGPYQAIAMGKGEERTIPAHPFPGFQGYALFKSLHGWIADEKLTGTGSIRDEIEPLLQNESASPWNRDYWSAKENLAIISIPQILSHLENLKEGNAMLFYRQIVENNKKVRGLAGDLDFWAVMLFAGVLARFLSAKPWDGIEDGIETLKRLHQSLQVSVRPETISSDEPKENAERIEAFAEFHTMLEKVADLSRRQMTRDVGPLINIYLKRKDLYGQILAGLATVLSTELMDKDWPNVFNKAFNTGVEPLGTLYPILGSWMGAIFGYRKLDQRNTYPFINSELLQMFSIQAVHKMLGNELVLPADLYFSSKEPAASSSASGTCILEWKRSQLGLLVPVLAENYARIAAELKSENRRLMESNEKMSNFFKVGRELFKM